MKRFFAGREFNVVQRVLNLSEIDSDFIKYQARLNDSPWIRGNEIARSVRDTGATKFKDNIVVAQRGNRFVILDGFGRFEAARILGWTEIEFDVLGKTLRDETLKLISLTANNGQVSQKAYTKRELAVNALKLHELGCTYDTIAEFQGVGVETIKKRVIRGQALVDAENSKDDLTRLQPFNGAMAALTVAKKVLCSSINLDHRKFDNPDEFKAYLLDNYNVHLRVLVGDNEKQVKGLAYEALDNGENEICNNFLILFYLGKVGANCDSGIRHAERLSSMTILKTMATFKHFELSPQLGQFNGRDAAKYLQQCRASMKQSMKAKPKTSSLAMLAKDVTNKR